MSRKHCTELVQESLNKWRKTTTKLAKRSNNKLCEEWNSYSQSHYIILKYQLLKKKKKKKKRSIAFLSFYKEKSVAKSQPIDVSRIKSIWPTGSQIPSCCHQQERDFIDSASVLCLHTGCRSPLNRNLALWISTSKTGWGSLPAWVAVWQPISYLRSMLPASHYHNGYFLNCLFWEMYSFQIICEGNLRETRQPLGSEVRWDSVIRIAHLSVFSWLQN